MGESFDEMEVWAMTIQLIKGLQALHENSILHRDLKSANIFITNDGTMKIGDLNVSKILR